MLPWRLPATGPPWAVSSAVVSAAYSTALRQCTSSKGAVVETRATVRSSPEYGASARALVFSSPSTRGAEAWGSPLCEASRWALPSSSCRASRSGGVETVSSIRSGRALRTGSVAGFQRGLRTRTSEVPGRYASNRYGPEETGFSP